MLEIKNLTKTYKKAKSPAIQDISFSVKNGEVFGLVGKNGAGKSTIIKCLLGIHPYQAGSIILNGLDSKLDETAFKKQIGYVPDCHPVYEVLTGEEYVEFMANVYKVPIEERERIKNEYAKLFDLENALNKQIKGYSYGMKQKICIIGSLVVNPKIWVLDEPFLGLDPKSVNILKQAIAKFVENKENMVLFSSHDMETVVEVCDRVCVVDSGRVDAILDMSKEADKTTLKQLME